MANTLYEPFSFDGANQKLDNAFNPEQMFNSAGTTGMNPIQGFDSILSSDAPAITTQEILGGKGAISDQFSTGATGLQESLFGNKNSMGWLTGGASALSGLAQAWGALEQIKLGKDTLNFNKATTNRNFANQAQTINTQLADRQRARIEAAGSGASRFASVDDYMKKNGINGDAI